jgi:hypothetical protein
MAMQDVQCPRCNGQGRFFEVLAQASFLQAHEGERKGAMRDAKSHKSPAFCSRPVRALNSRAMRDAYSGEDFPFTIEDWTDRDHLEGVA